MYVEGGCSTKMCSSFLRALIKTVNHGQHETTVFDGTWTVLEFCCACAISLNTYTETLTGEQTSKRNSGMKKQSAGSLHG